MNGFFQQLFLFLFQKVETFMRLRRESGCFYFFFYRVTVFGDVACVVLFQSRKDHFWLVGLSQVLLIFSPSHFSFCGTEASFLFLALFFLYDQSLHFYLGIYIFWLVSSNGLNVLPFLA